MKKIVRLVLASMLVCITGLTVTVHASALSLNGQDGDNKSQTTQDGTGSSGDADAGQIVGAVSSGKDSIDATNSSDHADISTGDARGMNDSENLTGQNVSFVTFVDNLEAADLFGVFSLNEQDGDNKTNTVQMADTLSGDGIGGQVIGVVSSAGGSSSVVAANTSKNVEVDTGDARSFQAASSFTGQNLSFFTGVGAFLGDVAAVAPTANGQDGDNRTMDTQASTATSGDGVSGQVLGVVSGGASSVDATNRSENVDLSSGDARTANTSATFAGQDVSFATILVADVVSSALSANLQEDDNRANTTQTANSTSGDVVGGQVAGVVTSAGGSADVVLANTSTTVDADSGDSRFANSSADFIGQNLSIFVVV